MDGESQMMGMIIELVTNLFQAFMFTTFLYLYFDKPESKLKRRLAYWGYVTVLFVFCSYFTLTGRHTGTETYYLDSLLCIATLMSYTLLFLEGKLYLRIIIPVFTFVLNALVSYTLSYVLVLFTGISIEQFYTVSTNSRYVVLVVVNVTTALLLWLALRLNPMKIKLHGASEVVAFSLIPVLCTVILYCCMFIYQTADFKDDILIYLLISCTAMIIIAVLTYLLLLRISKVNQTKTELLLTQQKQRLYEQNILATNRQIEKISNEKHDIKNKIYTLEKLIESGEYEKATQLCKSTTQSLDRTYTPVHTDDVVLNAILNVELEKTSSLGIDMTTNIDNCLDFLSSSDVVSIIGNLCDNAIEYLTNTKNLEKQMELIIRKHLEFCIITCKNRISDSVLKSNPQLNSSKNDSENHGRGISIVKQIAKNYDGEVLFDEEDGYFNVSVILNRKVK